MRQTFTWWCVGFVAGIITYAVACGGRIEEPYCDRGAHLCVQTGVCCADNAACGTGANGCPVGSCCLLADEPGEGTAATATQGYDVPSPPAPTPPRPSATTLPRPQ